MIKLRIKRKLDFYLSIALIAMVWISMGSKYGGIGFPTEDSLSYTTGLLSLQDNVRNTKHLAINPSEKGKESQVLACGYSVFGNGRSSGCGDRKFFAPYINKEVTIGWYKQNKWLWFENTVSQVVTIKTANGKIIQSYESTVRQIESNNKTGLFFVIFIIPLASFMYWAWGTLGKKGM